MGRIFVVEFDQTPDVTFYCCRICQAHIALAQYCFNRVDKIREGFFINAVNIVRDEPTHHRMEGESLVADIHCVRCNKPLGWTYIQSSNPDVPNGSYLFKLADLLFWDGTQLVNADTLPHLLVNVNQQNQVPGDNMDIN